MNRALFTTALAAAVSVMTLPTHLAGPALAASERSAYVQAVLDDRPVALLQSTNDLTGNGASGTAVGGPTTTRLPNGDPAVQFDGRGQYLSFSDRKAFEVDATGVLTVEFWMRPDTLQFSDDEGSGYVYTMGKGQPGAHEWYTRMYSRSNAESRPNRISGYAFNPAGGLGAGSYAEDPVAVGDWIHLAFVVNSTARSSAYPSGYTRLYKDGVLRDTDSLAGYDITPRSGSAPLRIGTGYLGSFFEGAIGDVAFFDKELTPAQVRDHYAALGRPSVTVADQPAPDDSGSSTPTTVDEQSSSLRLSGTNIRRGTDQLVRYDRTFGRSTGTNEYGIELAVVDRQIVAVEDGIGDMGMRRGLLVLSAHGSSRTWLREHGQVGDTIRIRDGVLTITDRP